MAKFINRLSFLLLAIAGIILLFKLVSVDYDGNSTSSEVTRIESSRHNEYGIPTSSSHNNNKGSASSGIVQDDEQKPIANSESKSQPMKTSGFEYHPEIQLTFPHTSGPSSPSYTWKPTSASAAATSSEVVSLVYTNLGDSFKFQPYIWVSMEQARIFNPTLKIYLVLSKQAAEDPVATEHMKRLDIIPLLYGDNEEVENERIREFKKLFIIRNEMVPDGNVKFNQYTLERLFALHAVMTRKDGSGPKGHIFHLENDNMLYEDVTRLVPVFKGCQVDVGIPLIANHDLLAAASFLYVSGVQHLEDLLDYTLFLLREKREDFISITDMFFLAAFLRDYAGEGGGGGKAPLPNGGQVHYLPAWFHNDNENCLWDHFGPTLYQQQSTTTKVLFDGAALGQYFGGTFNQPWNHHWEQNRIADYRGKVIEWRVDEKCTGANCASLKRPFINNAQVINIHIHSKKLDAWLSSLDIDKLPKQ